MQCGGAEPQILFDALADKQPPAFRRQRQPFAHDRIGGLPGNFFVLPNDPAA